VLQNTNKILNYIFISMLLRYLEGITGDLQYDFDVKDKNLILCLPQILEKSGNIMERYICYA